MPKWFDLEPPNLVW